MTSSFFYEKNQTNYEKDVNRLLSAVSREGLYIFLSEGTLNTMSKYERLGDDNKENCEHFAGIDETKVSPRTSECEECEKEGIDWVALRMCLSCGHVGCCDSSEGLHATRHFKQTGHPVMTALPNKAWKWCYVHKQYY